MGIGNERVRFVDHGIGQEVVEYSFLAAGQQLELQVGMTIALEPKLIFSGKERYYLKWGRAKISI